MFRTLLFLSSCIVGLQSSFDAALHDNSGPFSISLQNPVIGPVIIGQRIDPVVMALLILYQETTISATYCYKVI